MRPFTGLCARLKEGADRDDQLFASITIDVFERALFEASWERMVLAASLEQLVLKDSVAAAGAAVIGMAHMVSADGPNDTYTPVVAGLLSRFISK